jgi:hypothetical protein
MRPFKIPLALALCTAIGLVSALLGDGAWDALSWAALGAPVAAGIVPVVRARLKARNRRQF